MKHTAIILKIENNMVQKEKEKRRQEIFRKMRVYKLHVSELDILEEAGEL